ncbi:hypothetical protein K466DRAFT_603653 [Polyporus arcularius HHB13444]|uniref:Uncharacterized protein n=1 Tax=Polyporus arcularius HHB13444 TaxID=1314778 RepID=A0A5C3NYD3_9APHY|nr:hypothetical protein K466DRAFT_603653 [Polyporus arcularius HHB13444]
MTVDQTHLGAVVTQRIQSTDVDGVRRTMWAEARRSLEHTVNVASREAGSQRGVIRGEHRPEQQEIGLSSAIRLDGTPLPRRPRQSLSYTPPTIRDTSAEDDIPCGRRDEPKRTTTLPDETSPELQVKIEQSDDAEVDFAVDDPICAYREAPRQSPPAPCVQENEVHTLGPEYREAEQTHTPQNPECDTPGLERTAEERPTRVPSADSASGASGATRSGDHSNEEAEDNHPGTQAPQDCQVAIYEALNMKFQQEKLAEGIRKKRKRE